MNKSGVSGWVVVTTLQHNQRRYATKAKNNVIELAGRDTIVDPLTDLLRADAEKLIYQAVEAKLQEQLARYSDRRTKAGLAGVVHNGFLPTRELQTNLGRVTVR